MYITQIDAKTVTGIKVRTKNADEMNYDTSKISGLWQHFYADVAPHLEKDANVIGVYSNYESDFTGEFDVLAGSDMFESDIASESVTIRAGKYLVFEGKGSMPQVVIETWSKVWSYFSSNEAEHIRAYTTDFEVYKSDRDVEIFISIQ